MKPLIVLLSLALLLGCASPYKPQAEALHRAYQNGEISANDYFTRLTELETLELQRRQALGRAISQAGYHFGEAANKINQPAYYAPPCESPPVVWLNRAPQYPRSGSGAITTPGGQTYKYHYREDLSN